MKDAIRTAIILIAILFSVGAYMSPQFPMNEKFGVITFIIIGTWIALWVEKKNRDNEDDHS